MRWIAGALTLVLSALAVLLVVEAVTFDDGPGGPGIVLHTGPGPQPSSRVAPLADDEDGGAPQRHPSVGHPFAGLWTGVDLGQEQQAYPSAPQGLWHRVGIAAGAVRFPGASGFLPDHDVTVPDGGSAPAMPDGYAPSVDPAAAGSGEGRSQAQESASGVGSPAAAPPTRPTPQVVVREPVRPSDKDKGRGGERDDDDENDADDDDEDEDEDDDEDDDDRRRRARN